jgi:hypothetical protein
MERETGIEPVDIQLAKLAFYPCPLPYLPDTTPVPRNAPSGAALHVLRFSRMQRPHCCALTVLTPSSGQYGQYGSGPKIFVENLERETGLEPATFCLGSRYSTN